MSSPLERFAQRACDFRDAVWFVLAVNGTLLVLSAISFSIGGLNAAAEVVLVTAVGINVLSFVVAISVLVLCRRFEQSL